MNEIGRSRAITLRPISLPYRGACAALAGKVVAGGVFAGSVFAESSVAGGALVDAPVNVLAGALPGSREVRDARAPKRLRAHAQAYRRGRLRSPMASHRRTGARSHAPLGTSLCPNGAAQTSTARITKVRALPDLIIALEAATFTNHTI